VDDRGMCCWNAYFGQPVMVDELAIFAVDILVVYGLAAYGGQHRAL
jgi:hypothetical protein